MNSIAIKGIICPILTPMYEDESINEQELRNQVNRLIDAGIHGLFAFGTNGESYALSTAEKERVLEIVVEETNHRVPVYAGSGCITTKETIALSKKAFEIGADALSIVTPFYAAASPGRAVCALHGCCVCGGYAHRHVQHSSQNGQRTGSRDGPPPCAERPQHCGCQGFQREFRQYEAVHRADRNSRPGVQRPLRQRLPYPSGSGLWREGRHCGCANVFPRAMVKIYETWAAGDLEGAKRAQDDIRPFRNCFKYGNPNTIIKLATKELGVSGRELQKAVLPVVRRGHGADEGCSAGMCQQRNVLKT